MPPENSTPNLSNNKISRLFSYIEKVLSVEDRIERDFRESSTDFWWLANLPSAENLYFRKLASDENPEEKTESSWLRVERKEIKKAPALPLSLEEWVKIDSYNPTSNPKKIEKISKKYFFDEDPERVKVYGNLKADITEEEIPDILKEWVSFDHRNKIHRIEFTLKEIKFSDDPKREKLFENYVNHDWLKWKEETLPIYRANEIYHQLYGLRLTLKNEGDNYELLWAHGLLTWKNPNGPNIYHPVFLSPLIIEFDPTNRVIELLPDQTYKSFCEITSVCDLNNPAELDIIKWADKFNSEFFDIWIAEALKTQGRFLIENLSPDNRDVFAKDYSAEPIGNEHPAFWNSPLIYARRRRTDLWSKYAKKIRLDIEEGNAEPTPFVRDLVGDHEEPKKTSQMDETQDTASSLAEGELFFPLPWNQEQKRIVDQLKDKYGVVVKGPPGTGKSHTIANLISRFLAEGKTVLVTSQTSKALEVLRDKLPKDIQGLAVPQLGQNAKQDRVLQESISEISTNLNERHTKFSDAEINSVRKKLSTVREQKAVIHNSIREWVRLDSENKLSIAPGEDLTPVDAGREVADAWEKKTYSWFKDAIDSKQELPFSDEDITEVITLLKEVKNSDRSLHKFWLGSFSTFTDLESLEKLFQAYSKILEQEKKWKKLSKQDETIGKSFNIERAKFLLELASDAKGKLASLDQKWKKKVHKLCMATASEHTQWTAGSEKISKNIEFIRAKNLDLLGSEILIHSGTTTEEAIVAISVLKTTLKGKASIASVSEWFLPKNAKNLLTQSKVNGLKPNNQERLDFLEKKLLIRRSLSETKNIWLQLFKDIESAPIFPDTETNLSEVETNLLILKDILDYQKKFEPINSVFKQIKQFSSLSYCDIEHLDILIDNLESYLAHHNKAELDKAFDSLLTLFEVPPGLKKHDIVNQMVEALKNRSFADFSNAHAEYFDLLARHEKSNQLYKISSKLKQYAPLFLSDIERSIDNGKSYVLSCDIKQTWRNARLRSWLNELHDRESIDSLQTKLERLSKQENELNAKLIAIMAWQRQIDRVTRGQKNALIAWAQEMKKYGKGTGKYAGHHLRAAQEALKEARAAVPVWIMPLHRVATMFSEPKAGLFDVIIFDEASQCDLRGITVGYLGKKIIVVGDPEQISPAGIFQNQEKVFDLIARFLHDVPFKESFSTTSSLFDIAALRLPNIIMLLEHFRSVPDIIAFSNFHCYENKIKPLRHPNPKGSLKPALNPIFVDSGYQNTNNKVNEPEAKALVEKLIACLKDERYKKRPDGSLCSFGIISLLAEDQAKYIDQLLNSHPEMNEKIREERKIVCGDAYAFQGDERDVMFLSMVKALNEDDRYVAQTQAKTKQIFNVATTRAREQAFLFHSIPLDKLGENKEDWRFRLLKWYYDPQPELLKAGKEDLLRQLKSGRASQFSFDVGNLIIDRGYRVIPEYEVIGYRIDLVIQGDDARLAVECDGDQYHGLDQWEEDQFREQQLRRAGWDFWRLSGSSFYRYKDKSLDSLWKKLNEMKIMPTI